MWEWPKTLVTVVRHGDLLQIPPVRSHAEINLQRHFEFEGGFHLVSDELFHGVEFGFGDFEDQFVVDLEQHARLQVALAQVGVDADHGQLDEVGCGALQRSVNGGALGEAAQVPVLAEHVGERTDASEERGDLKLAARLLEGAVDELAHACVLFEVGVDEALGLFLVDADLLREPEGRESVDDAEVDGLGAAAVLGVNHKRRHAEDLRGGEGVDVVAAAVGFDQQRVGGEVGEQAELDLRVVGGEEQVAGFGDEGGANLAAQLGADGNVLQVGIDGGEASGGRAGHVEGGVQTTRARVQQRGQRVYVS